MKGTSVKKSVTDLKDPLITGDTLDEAIEATKEAAAAWVKTARDEGWPVPPPSPAPVYEEGWLSAMVELDIDAPQGHGR
jgi:predicted RNase H-like HicB family nuclease